MDKLTLEEYRRYGRQLLVPQFQSPSTVIQDSPIENQLKLKNSKVLVIGAGGLGCPALLYLASSGIGTIGVIDPDKVDESNLHRQVLHTTSKVGWYKVDSAKRYLEDLNPNVFIITYKFELNYKNCFEIISKYDLILDCTDTPMIRYLINDVCVILKKTIVSGSGLRTEGQLSILNFQNIGPCYRCFYPKAPDGNSVKSCSDGGVIGPCIGLVGIMMAIETIKIIIEFYNKENFQPFLSMFNGFNSMNSSIKNFKMRSRQKSCDCCGENPKISREIIESGELDYNIFCNFKGLEKYNVIKDDYSISVKEFSNLYKEFLISYKFKINENIHLPEFKNIYLIDVRPIEGFNIIHLPNFINIPLAKLEKNESYLFELFPELNTNDELFIICRFGNDSRVFTKILIDNGFKNVKNIKSGLDEWSNLVDPSFPTY